MKKVSDLSNLSISELQNKEKELRDEAFKIKMRHFSGELSDTSLIKKNKREIARVKTLTTQVLNKGTK